MAECQEGNLTGLLIVLTLLTRMETGSWAKANPRKGLLQGVASRPGRECNGFQNTGHTQARERRDDRCTTMCIPGGGAIEAELAWIRTGLRTMGDDAIEGFPGHWENRRTGLDNLVMNFAVPHIGPSALD